MSDVQDGSGPRRVREAPYISIGAGSPQLADGMIVVEALACISVNGKELATFMCTPADLEALALGFLLNEGLISGLADVRHLRVSAGRTCVDVWLNDSAREIPTRKIVTAGCGGGITFDDLSQQHEPLHSTLTATPEQMAGLMRRLHLGATAYQEARGIHTAALAAGDDLILQVEDVGRHNCLDKLAGAALQQGIDTTDRLLLTSGRISSEMLNKARRMGIPIICSRTSATSLSLALAEAWQITLVTYLRQDRMRVYTHPHRISGLPLDTIPAAGNVHFESSQ